MGPCTLRGLPQLWGLSQDTDTEFRLDLLNLCDPAKKLTAGQ